LAKDLNKCFRYIVNNSCINAVQLGFRRQGFILRRLSGQAIGVIQFQRSRTNTERKLSFTIELAIVVRTLRDQSEAKLDRVSCTDGHLRQRIGMLLPEKTDKWWEADSSTELAILADEISSLISDVAVPYVERYLDLYALVELWELQQSPGLTAIQRASYLDQLKSSLGSCRV